LLSVDRWVRIARGHDNRLATVETPCRRHAALAVRVRDRRCHWCRYCRIRIDADVRGGRRWRGRRRRRRRRRHDST